MSPHSPEEAVETRAEVAALLHEQFARLAREDKSPVVRLYLASALQRLPVEEREGAAADSGPGVLFSSGLIAGGAITGVVLAALAAKQLDQALDLSHALGALATSALAGAVAFVAFVCVPLFVVGRRARSTT